MPNLYVNYRTLTFQLIAGGAVTVFQAGTSNILATGVTDNMGQYTFVGGDAVDVQIDGNPKMSCIADYVNDRTMAYYSSTGPGTGPGPIVAGANSLAFSLLVENGPGATVVLTGSLAGGSFKTATYTADTNGLVNLNISTDTKFDKVKVEVSRTGYYSETFDNVTVRWRTATQGVVPLSGVTLVLL